MKDTLILAGKNIYDTTGRDIKLSDALYIISSPELKTQCDKLRNELAGEQNKDKRQKYKAQNFPYMCLAGTFYKRNNNSLKQASGLACIDIDDYDNEKQILTTADELKKLAYVLATFRSPSGGLKVVIRIPVVENDDDYKRIYGALLNELERFNVETDISNKDISRACYLSHDPKIYINWEAKEYQGKLKDEVIKKENIKKKRQEKDNSESGKDFRHILRLVSLGYDDDEIRKTLSLVSKKWDSKTESYRQISIRKAREHINSGTGIKTRGVLRVTNYQENVENFYKAAPFFFDKKNMFWFWDTKKSKYVLIDEIDLLNNIEDELQLTGEIISASVKNSYLEAFRRIGRRHIAKALPKSWVQFEGSIYDFKTGNIFKATPDFFSCNPIPHKIGESDETPNIDKIFNSWVRPDYVPLLYEIIAYCMLADYPIHRIFVLIGSGSNGKSKFLELIMAFLGFNNCASTELDDLLSRFGTTVVYKKLCCIMGETNFNILSKTSMLKKLTSDPVDFEFKGKDRFSARNYAKLIIATNTLPTTYDRTKGFYRRFIIIPFVNEFTEKVDVLGQIPQEEYTNLARKCITILSNILRKREFTNEGSVKEREEMYEEHSNPIKKFIESKCEINPDYEVPVFEFSDTFNVFLKKNGHRQMSKREIHTRMREEGFESKVLRNGDKTWRFYLGLRFKDKYVTDVTDVTLISTPNNKDIYKIQNSVTSVTSVTNSTLQQEIDTNSLTKWTTEAETWKGCEYEGDSDNCDLAPTNEYKNGKHYCKTHFNKMNNT